MAGINGNAKWLLGSLKPEAGGDFHTAFARLRKAGRESPLVGVETPFALAAATAMLGDIAGKREGAQVADKMMGLLRECHGKGVPLEKTERLCKKLIAGEMPDAHKKIAEALSSRSRIIFSQIAPYLDGELVLDAGAGDGKVGELIANTGRRVSLIDVVDYRDAVVKLPFKTYDGAALPYADKSFDTSVLSVVLHHADKPLKLLSEVVRVTKSRIVVIESVFFSEEHRRLNMLLDWLYNRVLHSGVKCPFNFCTPEEWAKTFEQFSLRTRHKEDLGIDQRVVPEYHYLYALDVHERSGILAGNIEKAGYAPRAGCDYESSVIAPASDFSQPGAKFQLVRFKPGTSVGAHYHEATEMFVVHGGDGLFVLNGVEMQCKAGDYILCRKGDVHEVYNVGGDDLVFLVFKTNEVPGEMRWVGAEPAAAKEK